jgi:acetolactate synthase-1/2/3 large subunit
MPMISGGQAVVEVLKAEGVRFVFGLPGAHTISIYDALYDAKEIRHILVRHEQAAANMAAAYAMLTGEPGICCATAGPGATNLLTGIAEAFAGALPVIALTGRGATGIAQRGACQEIPQEKIFAPVTKWSVRVDRSDLIVDTLRHAFRIARTGKPGPVLIDLPMDILMASVEFKGYVPVGKPPAPRGGSKLVETATERLLNSERPIVIAGGGCVMSGAFQPLRELAETLGLPVLTTLSGRGSFPDDHPLAAGGLGLHRNPISRSLLTRADFVLGLGCRFEQMETNWTPDYLPASDACYVQVDVDPNEIGRCLVPEIGIVGDIALVLEDMLSVARKRKGCEDETSFRTLPRVQDLVRLKNQLESDTERAAATDEVPLSPLRVVSEIRKTFPRETSIAIDIGCLAQAWGGAFPYFKIYEPRSCIPCTNFYAMGFAASGIPVAKLVYPRRPAVAICGDGSFQMFMHVLPVASDHQLPVTWCILNNGGLGSIMDIQEGAFKGRFIATAFEIQPEFAQIAEACHCYGEKVEDPPQIKPALNRALEANNKGIPAVLDFIVSREEPQAAREFLGGFRPSS